MTDQTTEPANHRAVWVTEPQVDLTTLDDDRLTDYRHPEEGQALLSIGLAVALFFLALAILHPQAADFLRWLPSGIARTAVEALHPTRAGPIILLAFAVMTLTDGFGLMLRLYDLRHEAVEVSAATFPQFAPVVDELRRRFRLERTRVYATRNAPMTGAAFGVCEPYEITLSSVLPGTLTVDEFKFLLGRQIGRIRLGHTRMALILGSGQAPLSFQILQQFRKLLFGNYLRAQELSADRTGLLATRDLRPVLSLITKLEIGTVRGARIDLVSLTPQADTGRPRHEPGHRQPRRGGSGRRWRWRRRLANAHRRAGRVELRPRDPLHRPANQRVPPNAARGIVPASSFGLQASRLLPVALPGGATELDPDGYRPA